MAAFGCPPRLVTSVTLDPDGQRIRAKVRFRGADGATELVFPTDAFEVLGRAVLELLPLRDGASRP